MRFDLAWGKVASENYVLKFICAGLFLLTLFFGVSVLKLSTQGALIIERSCFSKAVATKEDSRPPAEVEAFLKEALEQRFSSDRQVDEGYISAAEMNSRESEQKEFKARNMSQSFLFYGFEEKAGSIFVDADRIIRVGDVRSAFKFPLKVRIETKSRTIGNPYGLYIDKIEPVKNGEKR